MINPMLSITTLGTSDGDAVLFIRSDDRSLESLKDLPAWVWECEDAPVDVFVELGDRVLSCPITQLLLLAGRRMKGDRP